MNYLKTISTAILALSAFYYSAITSAADYSDLVAYEIEIVIFSSEQTRSAGSEIWPDLVETVAVDNSIELHNNASLSLKPGPDKPAYYYSKIPANKFRLAEEIEKLERSNKYKVIYHNAWIQPGLDKEKAEFIHIKSEDVNSDININPTQGIDTTFSTSQQNSLLFNSQGNNTDNTTALLDGVVKVELGRYLHVYFDLKYKRNLGPQEGVISHEEANYKDIKYYPIQTHRRMRSKEVHYIDHPLIGILVLATPFELPKNENDKTNFAKPLIKLNNIPVAK